MSCKTPILRALFDSPTVQTVDANGIIQLPDVTSNECCSDQVTGGSIMLRNKGTYEVHFNCTLVGTAAGAVEVQMYRNGSPIPGAHALGTATAVGDNVPLSFTALTTVDCCAQTIDFRCIDATTVRVANVTIERVD